MEYIEANFMQLKLAEANLQFKAIKLATIRKNFIWITLNYYLKDLNLQLIQIYVYFQLALIRKIFIN